MTCYSCHCCPCRCSSGTTLTTPFVRPNPSKLPCGCQVNSCSCVPPVSPGDIYYVKCKGTGTYLNNSASSSNPGNPIIGWHKDTTDNMKWKLCLKAGSNTDYYFESVGNGMYIGAAVALQPTGQVQATIQRTPIYFTIQKMNDGSFTFHVRGPGSYCFDVDHSSRADGAVIWFYPKTGNPNQQWLLEPCDKPKPKPQSNSIDALSKSSVPQGLYYVYCWGTGTYIKNIDWVHKPGNPIVASREDRQNNALWMLALKPGSITEYYFTNVANNQKIGYSGSLTGNGVKATLQKDPVYFTIKYLGNGIHNFCVTGTNYVFDVEGASSADNTNLLLFPSNGGKNQQWVFHLP